MNTSRLQLRSTNYRRRERCSSDHRRFSLNPAQRDILPHRQSQLSDLTIWLHIYDLFEVYTVVQKNAPTLADYNYDPVQSILIIFSKLFVNDHKSCLVVKFSTSPNICCHYTLWNTMLYFALITLLIAKCAISRQSSASSTRLVAAKQPGPKPSRLPHLGPDAAASVQDAGPWHSRLEEAPRWHMGQYPAVRRRRNRWPLDSTATRMREDKRLPVRTSAPVINRFFSEPPDPHHNRLFSEPPTFSRRKHVTGVQYRLRVNL